MKLLCIILSFSILFAGCYTNTPLTKDTPSRAGVTFRLNDGTSIVSSDYQRVEDGYQVVGELLPFRENFSGTITDRQIEEAVIVKFDTGKTVLAVVLTAGTAVAAYYAILAISFSSARWNWNP